MLCSIAINMLDLQLAPKRLHLWCCQALLRVDVVVGSFAVITHLLPLPLLFGRQLGVETFLGLVDQDAICKTTIPLEAQPPH